MPFDLSRFKDPGPHGSGRYSEHMLPEVDKKDFRKGAQVYDSTIKRKCIGWSLSVIF